MRIQPCALRSEVIAAVSRAWHQSTGAGVPEFRLCLFDNERRSLAHFVVHGAKALQFAQQELAALGFRRVAVGEDRLHRCDVLLVAGTHVDVPALEGLLLASLTRYADVR